MKKLVVLFIAITFFVSFSLISCGPSAKAEPAKAEPAKAEPAKAEPAKK